MLYISFFYKKTVLSGYFNTLSELFFIARYKNNLDSKMICEALNVDLATVTGTH